MRTQIFTAGPTRIMAAQTIGAPNPITLAALGQLHQLGPLGLKGTVGSSGSTVVGIRAAKPVGLWAAATRACGLIGATLDALGQLDQQGLLGPNLETTGQCRSSCLTVQCFSRTEALSVDHI